jgi:hypothetical protein
MLDRLAIISFHTPPCLSLVSARHLTGDTKARLQSQLHLQATMNSMSVRACFVLLLVVCVIDATPLASTSDEVGSVDNSADVHDAGKHEAKRWGL